jgi:hypothetical protein
MSRTSATPSGAADRRAVSVARFSAALSVIAVTVTRSASTVIFDRGSSASASSPNSSAAAQVSGTG